MSETNYQPFSVRHGHTQPKKIQLKDLDEDLRNDLWNVFYACFPGETYGVRTYIPNAIFKVIWSGFLKKPVDEFGDSETNQLGEVVSHDGKKGIVKDIFLSSPWYKVFDLMEFVIRALPIPEGLLVKNDYINQCNAMLQQENSAYQIIRGWVAEITSKEEIESIETAMKTPYQGVNDHLEKALAFFSHRENPDYLNSIKESISAVESLIKQITGKSGFSSGVDALGKHGINLHVAHSEAIKNLYGFASDGDGIRHGSKGDFLDINKNTARLLLTTCSAFVNFIIASK